MRPLRLLNLTLGLVAVLAAAALARTWVSPPDAPIHAPSSPKPSQEAALLAFAQTARPPLAQFDVLVEKNPFKQPPPTPVRLAKGAPLPPPVPLPTLSGTIFVDNERRAVLSDKGKSNIYAVGQELAGGIISEIKEDRIIFKRGDESTDIFLKAATETVPAARGQVAAPLPPALAFPMAPPGVEGSPRPERSAFDKQEKERRKEEKKLEKEQRKFERKQSKKR